MKSLFFTLVILGFSFSQSLAQLKFTNNSTEDVFIAIGYNDHGVWFSEGWWKLNIGETKILYAEQLTNRYYYYRAVGNTLIWEGSSSFYDNPNINFKIRQDNSSTNLAGLKKELFEMIDAEGNMEYTVTLTSETNYPHEPVYLEPALEHYVRP